MSSPEPRKSKSSWADVEVPLSSQDLVDHGVLWVLNASVFHPRGMALAVNVEEPGTFLLMANKNETIQFEPQVADEKFRAFEALVRTLRSSTQED